jgi:hypothetical protein
MSSTKLLYAGEGMEKLQEIIRQCNSLTAEIKCKRTPRNVTATVLFDLSYEHAASIDILCDQGRYGSAAALFRSCAEAYIRGSWVLYCATDVEVTNTLESNKKGKPLSTLVNELIIKDQGYDFLTRYAKSSLKNILDSLSHGKSTQIGHRFDGNSIGFINDPEVIKVLIQEACLFSLLSHASIAEIAQDESMGAKVTELFEQMHKSV